MQFSYSELCIPAYFIPNYTTTHAITHTKWLQLRQVSACNVQRVRKRLPELARKLILHTRPVFRKTERQRAFLNSIYVSGRTCLFSSCTLCSITRDERHTEFCNKPSNIWSLLERMFRTADHNLNYIDNY